MKVSDYTKKIHQGEKEGTLTGGKSGRLCQWTGCGKVGVVSTNRNGGPFYCRTHASELGVPMGDEPSWRNPILNMLEAEGKELPWHLVQDERRR